MNDADKAEVVAIVGAKLQEAFAFSTPKYGDTPTDALQLTPKKYVNSFVSVFAATSVMSSTVPGGDENNVQYHGTGSVFAGDSNFVWVPGSQVLRLGNGATVSTPDGGANASGKSLTIKTGVGNGSGSGGELRIEAGEAGATGSGGSLLIFAGNGGATSGNGGFISLVPGAAQGTGTNGAILMRSNDFQAATFRVVGSKQTTNNSFVAVPDVYATTLNSAGMVHARVVGFRTGGSAGSQADTVVAEMIQGVKNNAGTVTLLGSLTFTFFYGDNANCDVQFDVNGTTVELEVKGDTDNNYTWKYEYWYTTSN